jgi:F420-non-reducing hydrogenase iron-sulfur subunit
MSESEFEPKIVAFLCNWCSYRAADLAGTSRIRYSPNVRMIRLMCTGRVDPTFILKAFSLGADAVIVAGCHPGECHYIEQNYKAMRRFAMLRHTLEQIGIEPERLRLVWASAAEGEQLAKVLDLAVTEVRQLGSLSWPRNWSESATDLQAVERVPAEHAEAMVRSRSWGSRRRSSRSPRRSTSCSGPAWWTSRCAISKPCRTAR